MGNAPAAGEEEDSKTYDANFIHKAPRDAKSLVDEMYGADSEIAKGIEAVVRELESSGKTGATQVGNVDGTDVKLSAEAKRQKSRMRKADITAEQEADTWLKKQMKAKPAQKPEAAVAEEEPPPPPPPVIVLYTGKKS